MSCLKRKIIIEKKYFSVRYYRLLAGLCLLAGLTALVLFSAIVFTYVFTYFPEPELQFYASNSSGKITLLQPKDEPNNTDQYWLPPDPVEEMTVKKEVVYG